MWQGIQSITIILKRSKDNALNELLKYESQIQSFKISKSIYTLGLLFECVSAISYLPLKLYNMLYEERKFRNKKEFINKIANKISNLIRALNEHIVRLAWYWIYWIHIVVLSYFLKEELSFEVWPSQNSFIINSISLQWQQIPLLCFQKL
jgi:hypothetical protein